MGLKTIASLERTTHFLLAPSPQFYVCKNNNLLLYLPKQKLTSSSLMHLKNLEGNKALEEEKSTARHICVDIGLSFEKKVLFVSQLTWDFEDFLREEPKTKADLTDVKKQKPNKPPIKMQTVSCSFYEFYRPSDHALSIAQRLDQCKNYEISQSYS